MSLRKPHAPEFKAKAALEVLNDEETEADLVSRFRMHPTDDPSMEADIV